jgi:LITAF-like zinc ribbon domain
MENKQSSLYPKPSTKSKPSTKLLLSPELSEEPVFNTSHTQDTKLADNIYLHPQDNRVSTELSSYQLSTQQSVNLKRSFFMNSPKGSVSSTPFLLTNKLKELQVQSINSKLQDKLDELDKNLEIDSKSDGHDPEVTVDINEKNDFVPNHVVQSNITLEGDNDLEVPHLRWCAYCKAEVTTKAFFINNQKTFMSALGIFLLGGVLGCFMIPYMMNSCKSLRIVCKNCDRTLL